MAIISHDLIRSIIEYIPAWDLRKLSLVSPMFDREIHALGIRLFYDERYYTNLSGTKNVVIKTRTGKNFVLRLLDDHAVEIFTGRKVNYKEIIWVNNARGDLWWFHDRHTDYLAHRSQTCTIFSKNVTDGYNINLSSFAVDIRMGIKCGKVPRYIDLVNCMIYDTHGNGQCNITFDHFTIIFADNKFM